MDLISVIVGAGGLVGIVTSFLTYRTNKRERRIQWYDRAIDEIERLEGKLKDCRNTSETYRQMYIEEKFKNERMSKK